LSFPQPDFHLLCFAALGITGIGEGLSRYIRRKTNVRDGDTVGWAESVAVR
jgi:hypothetical protein